MSVCVSCSADPQEGNVLEDIALVTAANQPQVLLGWPGPTGAACHFLKDHHRLLHRVLASLHDCALPVYGGRLHQHNFSWQRKHGQHVLHVSKQDQRGLYSMQSRRSCNKKFPCHVQKGFWARHAVHLNSGGVPPGRQKQRACYHCRSIEAKEFLMHWSFASHRCGCMCLAAICF